MHDQILAEYPADLLADHDRLSELVVELINHFKEGITIHVIDPQSMTGILKSLRYRVRKYPTFIINGHQTIVGWNIAALQHALESQATH